jgi:uncharacterized protein (TIGR02453 family)
MSGRFNGFPEGCIEFYKNLRANNNKAWFDQHRDDFDSYVMAPAREFVIEMGDMLRRISPGVHAVPKINKSIFKIYRDTRFSRDKIPFKTNLAIWFWEGYRKRMDCSGYYFHLEPDSLMIGVGIYMFSKSLLREYRDSVVHPKYGAALVKAIGEVKRSGDYYIGGRHYKKTPRGYDPDHENSDLLLFNGFYIGTESKIPDELHSAGILDYCFERYRDMSPVHRWLFEMTERAG